MNRETIDEAVACAERFLAKVKELPKPRPYKSGDDTLLDDNFPKQQGAIRRASMDLTRALAEMRKPG